MRHHNIKLLIVSTQLPFLCIVHLIPLIKMPWMDVLLLIKLNRLDRRILIVLRRLTRWVWIELLNGWILMHLVDILTDSNEVSLILVSHLQCTGVRSSRDTLLFDSVDNGIRQHPFVKLINDTLDRFIVEFILSIKCHFTLVGYLLLTQRTVGLANRHQTF